MQTSLDDIEVDCGDVLNIGAVLFDMDGTLVDSKGVVEKLWSEFARRHNLSERAVIQYSHGRTARDTVSAFVPDASDKMMLVDAYEKEELMALDSCREIAGAQRLLRSLSNSRVAVVTSASRAIAEARLSAAGLTVPAVLITSDDVRRGKPDPSGFLAAAVRLGVDANDCLIFEDAEAGLQAAIASGSHVCVVGSHSSRTTAALRRVPDLSAVKVEVLPRKRIRLEFGQSSSRNFLTTPFS